MLNFEGEMNFEVFLDEVVSGGMNEGQYEFVISLAS